VGRGRRTYRVIVNEEVAKAYACLILEKPDIKSHKSDIFKWKGDGGLYEDIFRNTEAGSLLFCWKVYEEVSRRIKAVIKEYRKGVSRLPAKRKEQVEDWIRFIPHADTHLTAIIGVILKWKYGESFRFDRLRPLLVDNPQLYDRLFEWSADILAFYFDTLLDRVGPEEKSTFNHRNHLLRSETFQQIKKRCSKETSQGGKPRDLRRASRDLRSFSPWTSSSS
jgi:hypothetical protein